MSLILCDGALGIACTRKSAFILHMKKNTIHTLYENSFHITYENGFHLVYEKVVFFIYSMKLFFILSMKFVFIYDMNFCLVRGAPQCFLSSFATASLRQYKRSNKINNLMIIKIHKIISIQKKCK